MLQSTGNAPTILVADDEAEVREFIQTGLRCRGYKVDAAEDGEEVLQYLREGRPIAAVLLDVLMPRKNGFDMLREIRSVDADIPVIMVSGASSTMNVVEEMRIEATDFVPKPVVPEELRRAIKAALDARSTRLTAGQRRSAPATPEAFVSNSPRYRELNGMLKQIGQADVPVLILGETGVGKEVLAKQVHALSRRSQKVFIKLNCAALPS